MARKRRFDSAARVWEVVQGLPGPSFTAIDVMAASDGVTTTLKAIGRCLSNLVRLGRVEKIGVMRHPGDTHLSRIYAVLPPPYEPITGRGLMAVPTPQSNDVRHVRLQDARHWHREPSASRPWRGYESGLARIA